MLSPVTVSSGVMAIVGTHPFCARMEFGKTGMNAVAATKSGRSRRKIARIDVNWRNDIVTGLTRKSSTTLTMKGRYARSLVIALRFAGFACMAVACAPSFADAQQSRASGDVMVVIPGSELEEYLRYMQIVGA